MNYLFIGTTTADIVSNGRILGGTVSYGTPIVRSFGHNVRILTSFPNNDTLPSPLLQLADLRAVPSTEMTTFENIYSDGTRRQILHHTAKTLRVTHLPTEWTTSELVHLAPLADDIDYKCVHQFDNAIILLTPQGYMRQWDESGLVTFKRFLNTDMLSRVNILVLSKQDIAESPDLEQEFTKYVEYVIVTNGNEAGTYYENGHKHSFSVYPTTEVDPTGAGDVFASSLLASLPLVNHNMRVAIDVASRVAAQSVTVRGTHFALTESTIQKFIREAQQKYD